MPVTESPLRYPGGKTKIYSLVKEILDKNLEKEHRVYVEPYAGGAGLALKLLYMGDVESLILNDLDYHIFCFWNACLFEKEAFCEKISNTNIDIKEWKKQREIYNHEQKYTQLEVGFSTFFLNRCNISGIIEGGPIGGMEQLGKYKIDARFNKSSLIKKINKIVEYKEHIQLYNMDALDFLEQIVKKIETDNLLLNIDPPYVKKGPLLYRNSYCEEDHYKISQELKTLEKRWIVTYDRCELVERIYHDYRMCAMKLGYSAGKMKEGEEYIIYGDRLQ